MSAVDPKVRDIVEAHGQAVADGNMQRALEDFTEAVLSTQTPGRPSPSCPSRSRPRR